MRSLKVFFSVVFVTLFVGMFVAASVHAKEAGGAGMIAKPKGGGLILVDGKLNRQVKPGVFVAIPVCSESTECCSSDSEGNCICSVAGTATCDDCKDAVAGGGGTAETQGP